MIATIAYEVTMITPGLRQMSRQLLSLDRRLADHEGAGDLGIGLAPRHEQQDVPFPRGQRRECGRSYLPSGEAVTAGGRVVAGEAAKLGE
jgi:hypothetical protein